jgi:crossover junction endodeoxyribonuclease RuvC
VRVLGIDPGFATTGYGVVERVGGSLRSVVFGAVKTPPALPQAGRLAYLRLALLEIVDGSRPDLVAIERLFFNSNVRTAMSVGQASGVALAAAAEAGLEVVDYTPPEVKQSVVGVGNASKHQVQAMVAAILKLPAVPKPPDAADACALAICHLNRNGLSRAIATARQREAAG